ncbi:MAG: TIGR03619 family F420-dependent LLM class oxidoreductase [Acidimicrobiales bacterium]
MELAITFGQLNPRAWHEAGLAADALGFESVWLPEHLVFPLEMRGQLVPGEEHAPVPPSMPIYEPTAYLAWLAAQTTRIRLGTFVYLLGIRHPFVGARAFATLDVLSGGRAEVGVGAGWLVTEWEAVGLDPSTRGRRLDEAIAVCRRLWTEDVVEHHGEFFDFAPVMFEPKPIQAPHPPIVVGGESRRRCAGPPSWATAGSAWRTPPSRSCRSWPCCASSRRRPGAPTGPWCRRSWRRPAPTSRRSWPGSTPPPASTG